LDDNLHIPLSQDAALVLALAGTAMPFAHSAEDEAERWLRALRLHGRVGTVLQALGVGEAPLIREPERPGGRATPAHGPDILDEITRRATELAAGRGAETVATPELLFAVLEVYGKLFDRVLYLRGTSCDELVERLSEAGSAQPSRE
jgi:hypothetical protein